MYTRTIVEERPKNVAIMDVFSKLIQERIIFIDDAIDDELANGVIAQMMYLDSINHKEISIYINTPGGNVLSGLAIFDVAKLIQSPIKTICIGMAASMGAILMLMGQERAATKHSRIMIHQPSGWATGTVDEMKISYEEAEKLKLELFEIVREYTNIQHMDEVFKLDTWYTAKEALECGLLTKIL